MNNDVIKDFPEEVENIIRNDCFTDAQQEVLLELSEQIYNCLLSLNDKK